MSKEKWDSDKVLVRGKFTRLSLSPADGASCNNAPVTTVEKYVQQWRGYCEHTPQITLSRNTQHLMVFDSQVLALRERLKSQDCSRHTGAAAGLGL
jgi:hypothetical protein